jgi:hypothetical protein
MFGDGEWFYYNDMGAYSEEDGNGGIVGPPEIGMPIFFSLVGHRDYDWRMTTTVRNIEEIE